MGLCVWAVGPVAHTPFVYLEFMESKLPECRTCLNGSKRSPETKRHKITAIQTKGKPFLF